MRLKLISCDIFHREMCMLVARSRNIVDVTFLPKGLHDVGKEEMLKRVQQAVDDVTETDYETILLGYGLCNNGIVGLTARTKPIVIPRAHDCITLFLGSQQRYRDYFDSHPGTYFLTSGWLERGDNLGDLRQASIGHQMGMDMTYDELVAKYGQDNASFLYDQLCNTLKNYTQYTFIETGIGPEETLKQQAKCRATESDMKLETIRGDLSLMDRLLNGPWDPKDFLILPVGHRVAAGIEEGLIRAENIEE